MLEDPGDQVPTGDMPPSEVDSHDRAVDEPSGEWRRVSERAGDMVGPYRLVEIVGRGTYGTVWRAVREDPFPQTVAVKIMNWSEPDDVRRFEREREILAQLRHPGIAAVHTGGVTPAGRVYFAMEFVEGIPFAQFCDERKLSIPERLMLFVQLCEAIQHAHTAGVIHRDLKPSNVLVSCDGGGKPHVKVIDFGEAKTMLRSGARGPSDSLGGRIVGTPEYMSPEQASPSALLIDVRTDVYSLGVMLYEVLVGARPFESRELRDQLIEEMKRRIVEDDPPSPSARLSNLCSDDAVVARRIERTRGVSVEELRRQLRRELEWIPLKAMRKERERRYERPIELARDIENYLERRPLVAGPDSAAYRLRKFVRRHRWPVVTGVASLVSLVVFATVVTWLYLELRRTDADRAEALIDAEKQRNAALAAKSDALASAQTAEDERVRATNLLAVVSMGGALDAARDFDPARVSRELAPLVKVGRDDRFAAGLARAMSDNGTLVARSAHSGGVLGLSFSGDGGVLVSAGADGLVRVWDGSSLAALGPPLRSHVGEVRGVAISRDASTIAAAGDDASVRLWRASDGEPIFGPLEGHRFAVTSVSFDPDGRTLVSGAEDGTIRRWSLADGTGAGEIAAAHRGAVSCVGFSPDGAVVASGGGDSELNLWDPLTGGRVLGPLRGHEGRISGLDFSPDGGTIASSSDDGTLRLWDRATGAALLKPLRGHVGAVRSVCFSADGTLLASAGVDRTVRLWNATTGAAVGVPLSGSRSSAVAVRFHRDGRLVGGGRDGSLRAWHVGSPRLRRALDGAGAGIGSKVTFGVDGRVGCFTPAETILLWDPEVGSPSGHAIRGSPLSFYRADFSPDLKWCVLGGYDGTARVVGVESGTSRVRFTLHNRSVRSVCFAPDGNSIATGGSEGETFIWDARTGMPSRRFGRHLGSVVALAFSGDGATLASGGNDGTGRLWDVRTGRAKGRALSGHAGPVFGICFLPPDGRVVATRSADATVRLWDTDTGGPIGKPIRHELGAGGSICFTPDGRTMALGGLRGEVQLWDTASWEPIGEPLAAHEGAVSDVSFSHDGRRLVSAGGDGTVRVWDAVPMRDRVEGIRRIHEQVASIRSQVARQLSTIGPTDEDLAAFQQSLLADRRFSGELRRAALLLVGEIALERQAASSVVEPSQP